MKEATDRILEYCKNFKNVKDFSSQQQAVDACIRNFQILGDASKNIPTAIKKEVNIPWRKIKGMRNVLVHEYFGVNSSIVWNTIKNDLPKLQAQLQKTIEHFETEQHPWKICPAGEFYVRAAHVREHVRQGKFVKAHLRSEHCRESHTTGKIVLTLNEIEDVSDLFFKDLSGPPAADSLGHQKTGNLYNHLIRGWTKYWNEIFKPDIPLDPDLVKALIKSESDFDIHSGKGKRGKAKGMMQLMPKTIRYLRGEQKELQDHIFEFSDLEVYDPNFNIAAGIRWLFRKRETASARLKRKATWEETVEEYKDYLRRRLKNPKERQKGMEIFRDNLKKLKNFQSKGK